MRILLVMNVCTGALLCLISVPLILRWIGPNLFYGFRVRATLKNPDVWFDVNAYAGWWLLAAGLTGLVASIAFALVPGISLDQYALGSLGVVGAVLVVGVVFSIRYLRARDRG